MVTLTYRYYLSKSKAKKKCRNWPSDVPTRNVPLHEEALRTQAGPRRGFLLKMHARKTEKMVRIGRT